MKGPGLRNDLEIRRMFKCPQCGRTVLKLGDEVSVTCPCTDPPTWMKIQPDPPKRTFHFDKIEIPLTEEDLVIRERPRRMPPPPPEGVPENDRRPAARPKRPKPERRSFESFQEDLAAKVEAEAVAESNVIKVTISQESEIVAEVPAPPPEPAPEPRQSESADEEFGQGL